MKKVLIALDYSPTAKKLQILAFQLPHQWVLRSL